MTGPPAGPRIGLDIGGTKLLIAAVWPGRTELHTAPTGRAAGPEVIERELRSFLVRLGVRPALIGVAVPGLVGAAGEVVACDVLPRLDGWQTATLGALDGDGGRAGDGGGAGPVPVHALNDVEAGLIEELPDFPDAPAVLVLAGTGIGAAVAIGGAPYRGADGWAGELGSIPIRRGGRTATLDELASGASLAARCGGDGEALAARAAAGDAEVLSAIAEAGAALGLGLATVVNLLNPRLLVIGGGTVALPGYLDAALASAARAAMPDLWRACTVRAPRRGRALVALGAVRAAALRLGEEAW
jgi:glucokinase